MTEAVDNVSTYPRQPRPHLIMITRSIFKVTAVLVAGACMSVASAAKPTLQQVTEETEAAVAKAPDKAAEIVAEKVKATPEYACPIIKAAVKGGNLAKEVQPDLVAAALEAAPEQAPEIKACLPNLIEGAAGKGGAAGKEGATGKDTVAGKDKAPAVEVPIEEEGMETGLPGGAYDPFYGVVGYYLNIPASGAVVSFPKEEKPVIEKPKPKPPKRPRISNPATNS